MEENLREYIEEGTDTIGGQYTGRGEQRYKEARVIMPRMTHDIFIHYKNGILLMVRVNEPAKGMLWCPGGSVEKFVSIQESLRRKVKEECGLDIKNIEFLGLVRFYWKTDPYGGNKGVDDFSLVYMAEGEGEISIDKTHKEYKIIEKEEYEKIKETLHPFIREFMDLVIKKI